MESYFQSQTCQATELRRLYAQDAGFYEAFIGVHGDVASDIVRSIVLSEDPALERTTDHHGQLAIDGPRIAKKEFLVFTYERAMARCPPERIAENFEHSRGSSACAAFGICGPRRRLDLQRPASRALEAEVTLCTFARSRAEAETLAEQIVWKGPVSMAVLASADVDFAVQLPWAISFV